jgi:hypothetical protein
MMRVGVGYQNEDDDRRDLPTRVWLDYTERAAVVALPLWLMDTGKTRRASKFWQADRRSKQQWIQQEMAVDRPVDHTVGVCAVREREWHPAFCPSSPSLPLVISDNPITTAFLTSLSIQTSLTRARLSRLPLPLATLQPRADRTPTRPLPPDRQDRIVLPAPPAAAVSNNSQIAIFFATQQNR